MTVPPSPCHVLLNQSAIASAFSYSSVMPAVVSFTTASISLELSRKVQSENLRIENFGIEVKRSKLRFQNFALFLTLCSLILLFTLNPINHRRQTFRICCIYPVSIVIDHYVSKYNSFNILH